MIALQVTFLLTQHSIGHISQYALILYPNGDSVFYSSKPSLQRRLHLLTRCLVGLCFPVALVLCSRVNKQEKSIVLSILILRSPKDNGSVLPGRRWADSQLAEQQGRILPFSVEPGGGLPLAHYLQPALPPFDLRLGPS